MSLPQALEALCAEAGIELSYHDIWGTRHTPPEASLRAFLAEMGRPADDDTTAGATLRAWQAEQRCEALPPVWVLDAAEAVPAVPLQPSRLPPGALSWRLLQENGQVLAGVLDAPHARGPAPGPDHTGACCPLPPGLQPGYHRLVLHADGKPVAETRLVVAPARCWQPPALADGARAFGPSLQVYSLRSARNWGIGDFTDLLSVLDMWAARGADFLALSPLHAMFLHDGAHASPYSPSSRLFLNVLYIDVEQVPDLAFDAGARAALASDAVQARLARLRAAELVDYDAVLALKLEFLRRAYRCFIARREGDGQARAQAFEAWQARQGRALRLHALFDALGVHFHACDSAAWRWQHWPAAYQHPDSPEVEAFALAHAGEVAFYEYLQWQAAVQLEAVAGRARSLGLRLGLYLDLALAPDRGGAELWSQRGLFAEGAGCGAPPDDFSLVGQDWGLPPPVPERLRRNAYRHFIAVLRAGMAPAGAVRIDHVMALMRLFWVPPGGRPADGAYVRYDFRELLAIVALESQRQQCLVVGEDLGTVPPEVRAALGRAGVLSYRLFYFEKQADGEFQPPEAYPPQALVACSTHDLPTLSGFWAGRDLEWRDRLGLFPGEQARDAQHWFRGEDRARLLRALMREGLLSSEALAALEARADIDPAVLLGVQVYLARTPCRLLAVQLEDVEGATEQANLPGTTDQHPNWRRRLRRPLEHWPGAVDFLRLTAALAAERGRD